MKKGLGGVSGVIEVLLTLASPALLGGLLFSALLAVLRRGREFEDVSLGVTFPSGQET